MKKISVFSRILIVGVIGIVAYYYLKVQKHNGEIKEVQKVVADSITVADMEAVEVAQATEIDSSVMDKITSTIVTPASVVVAPNNHQRDVERVASVYESELTSRNLDRKPL